MIFSKSATNFEQQTDFLHLAQCVHRLRRDRDDIFNNALFADPAWDLLLDLYVRTGQGQEVDVASACKTALVPVPTAIRYLNVLVEQGYIDRAVDGRGENSALTMSPLGRSLMMRWLTCVRERQS